LRDRAIAAVYASILLLGLGYGIALSVGALQLDRVGFSKAQIGSLAAWFGLGLVCFSLPAGALVRRWGGWRVLPLAMVAYAVCVAVFPFLDNYVAVGLDRSVDGIASVTIWVSAETVLLERAPKTQKGHVMSLYAIMVALGYLIGPLLARGITALVPMERAFAVASVLALSAAVVAFRGLPRADGAAEPRQQSHASEDGGADGPWVVLSRVRTSCAATFAYGFFQSAVVLFLPLYLIESKGIARASTIVIPAFFAGGMLLFSNVAARWGDRRGHLFAMRSLGLLGGAMTLMFIALDTFLPMCVAVFVAGAALGSISPLSLALQGVVTPARSYARANALYNAFYAAGILVGPPLSGLVFERAGGGAMLAVLGALWGGFVALAWLWRSDDPMAERAVCARDASAPRLQ
jgi:MFS family permease